MEVGIKEMNIKEEKDIGKIFRILQEIIKVMDMVEIVQVVRDMGIGIVINNREIMDGMIMKEEEIWVDLEQEEDNNKIIIRIKWDRDD